MIGLPGDTDRLLSSCRLRNELRLLGIPVDSVLVDESWHVDSVRVGESIDMYDEWPERGSTTDGV